MASTTSTTVLQPYRVASAMLGLAEIVGPRHEPSVLGMLKKVFPWITTDETPWCAAFMSFVLETAGYPDPKTVRARDFERYGTLSDNPMVGRSIMILTRGTNASQGHVGFFVARDSYQKKVYLLGGNQGNRVSIMAFDESRVVAYRDLPGPIIGKSRYTGLETEGEIRARAVAVAMSYSK